MGWFETAMAWIQEYWLIFTGIITSQTFLLIILSLLKTRRILAMSKMQAQRHSDNAKLHGALEHSEKALTDKFNALESDLQAFMFTTLNAPWNSEQRKVFEDKKAELTTKKALSMEIPQSETVKLEAPKKIKKKIVRRIVEGGA